MSFESRVSTGSLIGAYLPTHLKYGEPGDDFRLALVLGVETDPLKNSLEGLWVARLSSRMEKVRRWDCVLLEKDIEARNSSLPGDHVIRTPRIDLIPACASYLETDPKIYGNVRSAFWQGFLPKLAQGQNSSFACASYGPREKLAHTFAAISVNSHAPIAAFDYAELIHQAAVQSVIRKAAINDDYARAQKQADAQTHCLRRRIHEDFQTAVKDRKPWSYEDYSRAALPEKPAMLLRSARP